jgi:hypothetical protein
MEQMMGHLLEEIKTNQAKMDTWQKETMPCQEVMWVLEEVGCRAIPALHKGQGKDKAVPRTEKGHTFGTRHWVKPEGVSGIGTKT